jgi:hypothetical protein
VKSEATTVAEYLASLPPERREAIAAERDIIRANLPDGYVEAMDWGKGHMRSRRATASTRKGSKRAGKRTPK